MLAKGISTSLEELKYKFTIDQVYLFFEKCLKAELEDRKFQAMMLAQSVSYASPPPMGADKSYMNSKQRSWDKFMKTLEWKSGKGMGDIREVKSLLSGAGIPIKVIKKGDDK